MNFVNANNWVTTLSKTERKPTNIFEHLIPHKKISKRYNLLNGWKKGILIGFRFPLVISYGFGERPFD